MQNLARIGMGGARYGMPQRIGVQEVFGGCKVVKSEGTTYIMYIIYRMPIMIWVYIMI